MQQTITATPSGSTTRALISSTVNTRILAAQGATTAAHAATATRAEHPRFSVCCLAALERAAARPWGFPQVRDGSTYTRAGQLAHADRCGMRVLRCCRDRRGTAAKRNNLCDRVVQFRIRGDGVAAVERPAATRRGRGAARSALVIAIAATGPPARRTAAGATAAAAAAATTTTRAGGSKTIRGTPSIRHG